MRVGGLYCGGLISGVCEDMQISSKLIRIRRAFWIKIGGKRQEEELSGGTTTQYINLCVPR